MRDPIRIQAVESITNKELIEELYYTEPFVCKLLIEGFKGFLEDDSFESYERQLVLLKFLKNNYPLELSREIITFAQNCNFSNDYSRIILEWNYFASDFIKQYTAAQYDSQQLAFDISTKQLFDHTKIMQ